MAFAAVALGPSAPQAAAAQLTDGLLETVMSAALDPLAPPSGATLKPVEHVAYPICLHRATDTVSLHVAPAMGDLPDPLDVGSMYTTAAAFPGPLTC